MIQIIYTSVAAADLAPGEVFSIIEISAGNNARNDLTGFLLFRDGEFFQVVEGPEPAIDALLRRLEADTRHHSITMLHREPIAMRHFAKWKMKRLAVADETVTPADIAPELATAPLRVHSAVGAFLKGKAGPRTQAA